ncbi:MULTISPECIES: MurR/RpiR family transcriptional regulator [unclassified Rhizobium]|jgi:DNA-binding MurR/RpiR family transcriptional regulator|uniref:MurR/RpiR family transcriptional regulator n=1 Tax=Rhizobium sp. Rhizsp82 TaxID=3243057 RepID=UPI000DDC2B34
MQLISLKAESDVHEFLISKNFWAAVHRNVPERLAALARLAAERPDVFAFESSQKIAERCKVSQTSVVRFAQHLGFDGFAEMKQGFQHGLRQSARRAS